MMNLIEHYDRLSSQFEKCWRFSDDYVENNKSQIIDLLELKKEDVFVDLGCGSGLYSKLISDEIKFTNRITCVDFSEKMIEQINGIDCEKYQENIVEFSKRKIKYTKILSKEIIHHIDHADRKGLFGNLYDNLENRGKFLILTYSNDTNLPLFEKAKIAFSKIGFDIDKIVLELTESGFHVVINDYNLLIKIDKTQYYNNLRNRFISILKQFTDKEIESGIIELETEYNSIHEFVISDKMISILATKN